MKTRLQILAITLMTSLMCILGCTHDEEVKVETETVTKEITSYESSIPTYDVQVLQKPEFVPSITDEEIDLIATITMAEAEGECELGKRAVIDTILNRVDSEYFPDTVKGVIYQPSQFSCVWNGRANRCYVMDEIRQLVLEELEHRGDTEVMFFNAGHYSSYGKPIYQIENHYFSKL